MVDCIIDYHLWNSLMVLHVAVEVLAVLHILLLKWFIEVYEHQHELSINRHENVFDECGVHYVKVSMTAYGVIHIHHGVMWDVNECLMINTVWLIMVIDWVIIFNSENLLGTTQYLMVTQLIMVGWDCHLYLHMFVGNKPVIHGNVMCWRWHSQWGHGPIYCWC